MIIATAVVAIAVRHIDKIKKLAWVLPNLFWKLKCYIFLLLPVRSDLKGLNTTGNCCTIDSDGTLTMGIHHIDFTMHGNGLIAIGPWCSRNCIRFCTDLTDLRPLKEQFFVLRMYGGLVSLTPVSATFFRWHLAPRASKKR